ncbi:MAG: S-layer homology domain-containing protein [Acidimicrobiia bacterium]|nr:S-layer homology domain-containing protein [Acidimicrobiia bacterium]
MATNERHSGSPAELLTPVMPTACGAGGSGPFQDMAGNHQFCAEIEWMAAHGITEGFPDGGFHPAGSSTRQAIAAFLYRLVDEPAFSPPPFQTFVDVGPDHTFYGEIEWAAAEGLVNGFADGTYRSVRPVTRQALAAMLYRLAGEPDFTSPDAPTFWDVPTDHPFFREIEWLASTGITEGYPDGSFRAGRDIPRQGIAAFLHRFDQQFL